MVQGNGWTQDETTYTDNRSDSSVTISQPVSTVWWGGTYTYIPLPEPVRVALEVAQPLKEEIIESYVPKYKILDTIRDIILETQESIEDHFVAPASLPNTGAE